MMMAITTGVAVAGAVIMAKMLRNPSRASELAWEKGRRLSFRPVHKDNEFYLSRGVQVKEELKKNSRSVEIYRREWLPQRGRPDEPKALIFLCHGYADTCAYLNDDLAVRLVENGYAVFGMDYEGHGLSEGLHAYIPSFNTLVEDCIEHFQMIKERSEYSGKKCFLFGDSMGGAVSIIAHLKRPEAWDGAVLVAPMCQISDKAKPPKLVVEVLKKLVDFFPTLPIVPSVDICEAAFKVPEKRARGASNPVGYPGRLRLRTGQELLNAVEQIAERMEEINMPFLVLHGGADVLTDPSYSKELFKRAQSSDKSIRMYEGSWHNLLHGEPDCVVDKAMEDIIGWLDAHSRLR
ncbi:hypothetical protein CBR_g32242 [Chara braunii]|uniref:Serine aminopeptidase S33 domain-containing protein n=1 Tax=Chara braunii TaxID=69332 RepID=A0A388JN84_CHABU|nr:hypothetical protein CBR_g32242 [Chara braunii]|eukprot:GBG59225.1 hypothetical protein CBR_g32242 [Chara braunii]